MKCPDCNKSISTYDPIDGCWCIKLFPVRFGYLTPDIFPWEEARYWSHGKAKPHPSLGDQFYWGTIHVLLSSDDKWGINGWELLYKRIYKNNRTHCNLFFFATESVGESLDEKVSGFWTQISRKEVDELIREGRLKDKNS